MLVYVFNEYSLTDIWSIFTAIIILLRKGSIIIPDCYLICNHQLLKNTHKTYFKETSFNMVNTEVKNMN